MSENVATDSSEQTVPKPKKTGLLLVFVTVFIDLLGFGIVLPLLPRYGRHFHADGFQLGLLMASFSAMQFLFAPIWGRLSDRIGRRPVLMVGLAGSTISYALFGFATSLGREGQMLGMSALTWLFITRIGAGIAGATISTAQAYIADVTGPKERAKGMALIGAAFGIGFTFGPLLGAGFVSSQPTLDLNAPQIAVVEAQASELPLEQLVSKLRETGPLDKVQESALRGYLENTTVKEQGIKLNAAPSAAPGYVAAVLSLLALLTSIFFLPESLKPDSAPSQSHWLNPGKLTQAFRQPKIAIILLSIFLSTFAFAQFESTLSLLTQRLGMAARHNFFVFAYIGFILTISQGFLVRRLVPRLGEYRMGLAGAILMAIGLALIGFASINGSRAFLYAVLPVSVVGFSALTPSLQSLLSRLTAATAQGSILGVGQSISSLARILGPMLGLVLEEKNSALPYFSGAVMMLLGGLLVMGLGRGITQTDVAE